MCIVARCFSAAWLPAFRAGERPLCLNGAGLLTFLVRAFEATRYEENGCAASTFRAAKMNFANIELCVGPCQSDIISRETE